MITSLLDDQQIAKSIPRPAAPFPSPIIAWLADGYQSTRWPTNRHIKASPSFPSSSPIFAWLADAY